METLELNEEILGHLPQEVTNRAIERLVSKAADQVLDGREYIAWKMWSDGWKHSEIGEEIGCSRRTAGNIIKRACIKINRKVNYDWLFSLLAEIHKATQSGTSSGERVPSFVQLCRAYLEENGFRTAILVDNNSAKVEIESSEVKTKLTYRRLVKFACFGELRYFSDGKEILCKILPMLK